MKGGCAIIWVMMKGAERKNLLGALGIGWAGRVMKGEGVGKKPVAAVE